MTSIKQGWQHEKHVDIKLKKASIFFNTFFKLFDLKKIVLFHLNDSKYKLGSKIDRHEKLGKGFIGFEGIKQIIKICYHFNIPIILETPLLNHTSEITSIKKIINN